MKTQNHPLALEILSQTKKWLITGVAGFIGSNLLEFLLAKNQKVTGLDNFFTGYRKNLESVKGAVAAEQWNNFTCIEGDIRDFTICQKAVEEVDFVLHHAALGSVPKSIEEPLATNEINVTGTLNIMLAAGRAGIKRVVYASSSAIYGDDPTQPKSETMAGRVLSPYAASKQANEIYAQALAAIHGMELIGLRYFNIFGKRQDPQGAYAAVIPKWISELIQGQSITIYGTGETSRDFCHVNNVVQANLLAATTTDPAALNTVYNIASGETTTLNQLFEILKSKLKQHQPKIEKLKPKHEKFRSGDILHSSADISKATELLHYRPSGAVSAGIDLALDWYLENNSGQNTLKNLQSHNLLDGSEKRSFANDLKQSRKIFKKQANPWQD